MRVWLPQWLVLEVRNLQWRLLQRIRYGPDHDPYIGKRLARFQRERSEVAKATQRPSGFESGLTVVVTCWGHEAYLEDTVRCIAAQTYDQFNVMFVDDHSPDSSLRKLNQLVRNLPDRIRFEIVQTPYNLGQMGAINYAVRASDSIAYVVLHDDDYLMHDAIEAYVAILQANQDLYLLGAGHTTFAGTEFLRRANKFIKLDYRDYTGIPIRKLYPSDATRFRRPGDLSITQSGSVFFRVAWAAVGGYVEKKRASLIEREWLVQCGDRDFQMRVCSLFPVGVVGYPFSYRRSDSSVGG